MPDSYNLNDALQISGIRTMLQRISTRLAALESAQGITAFQPLAVDGNTVKFFTTSDTTTTPAYSFDFPEEIFLDQAGTTLVQNFAWSAVTYPNSTNPNLDGKTVLVLAVKGDATTPTVKYSFVDMAQLVDVYVASDTSITISDYSVKVNVSAAANNALTLQNDGLYVDISGKVNKFTGATAGNICIFDSDGGVSDTGIKFATDAEFTAMLDEVFPVSGGS